MSLYSISIVIFFVAIGLFLLGVFPVVMAIVGAITAFVCALCVVTSNRA